jgi:hypothetical protein
MPHDIDHVSAKLAWMRREHIWPNGLRYLWTEACGMFPSPRAVDAGNSAAIGDMFGSMLIDRQEVFRLRRIGRRASRERS